MAVFRSAILDAHREIPRQLMVALAGFCLLTMSAHAQPAGAAPTPADTAAQASAANSAQKPSDAAPSPAVQNAAPPATSEAEGTSSAQTPDKTPHDPKDIVESQQRLVTRTEDQFGKRSRQAAEAYVDLAEAQRRAGDHAGAEKSYLAAIDVYHSLEGPFTPLAIEPLTALGDNYRETNDYMRAVTAYGEARTINRRVYGLLNEDQIPLIDRISDVMLELNKPADAEEQQLDALRIVERSHPPESDEALGALYKYAGWLREQGRFQEERDQYMRALRTVHDHYGKEDPHEVPALLGIGNSFRVQRIPEPQGAGALHDALQILTMHGSADKLALAETLRDIGDWEVAFTKVDYDGAEYRRSWQYLGEVADGDKYRKQWYSGPNYVLREPVSLAGLSQDPNSPAGHVIVKFDLDKTGHASNVTIVESDPPGFKDEAVIRHIRRSRFRPQMADGLPVAHEALALQFNYRYSRNALLSDKDKEKGKSAKE
ncbi:MAG TPA: tetratricopeptide repeat protein [Gammaproteobacteria bacterium]|nr:tetratricopeptide repeat protein [Gammaproteobacteria bacterium]